MQCVMGAVVAICNNSQFETLSQYATNPIMRCCRILQKSHNEKMSQFENSRSANSQFEIVSFCNNVAT